LKPYYEQDDIVIYHGNCREILPSIKADAVVTDPPYGLSFMGKRWDYDVPSVEIWAECLRVLKPGGHLLAFAGTRTQHRMAVRIEDAGFEIRDMIAWVYGSGFPKSLDVSKAIDKVNGNAGGVLDFCLWFRTTGVTRKDATTAMVEAGHIGDRGTMAGHYFAASYAGQPAIPTSAIWATLRPLCGDVPEWVDELVARIEAEREVVGKHTTDMGGLGGRRLGTAGGDITAPATPEAQQWQGWGTALKPALEPITVARKPLEGTVAENVLKHGVGGINVDGCRVGTEVIAARKGGFSDSPIYGTGAEGLTFGGHAGRWPANLIHDGSDEVVGLFPVTTSGSSAARFFYCAKASKADRSEGNIHPTVKPTDLMRYLCRLVTPPGGIVLDPFMGSGTTLVAAKLEGRKAIGIELEEEYCEIAAKRLAQGAFSF
jgi:hypothetical protein